MQAQRCVHARAHAEDGHATQTSDPRERPSAARQHRRRGIINVKHVGMWATVVYSIWFSAVVLLGLGLDALKLLRGRRGRGGGGDAEQAGVGGAAEPNGSAGGEGKSSGSSGEVRGGSCGDV